YLRCNRRFKDGKEHCYWNIVEAKRCADGRMVQRQVLYLGEINDSQREAWCRVIEAFDEDAQRRTQLAFFPGAVNTQFLRAGSYVPAAHDLSERNPPITLSCAW
ncbi:MAG: hypothetical protein ABIQ03_04510, partial [Burkholderiales bacterium]